VDFNSKIQGYNVYPMLHFRRKFFSGVTAPFHHCGLAMFGNSEVFFVSLSLLSHCFVIIIKYSRAQKGTQASHSYYHPSLLL